MRTASLGILCDTICRFKVEVDSCPDRRSITENEKEREKKRERVTKKKKKEKSDNDVQEEDYGDNDMIYICLKSKKKLF